jgi:hypothetical protein
MRSFLAAAVAMFAMSSGIAETSWQTHGPIRVSENKRFLVHQDNTPFFYLGDTAWELFHRLDREEATHYLTDRAKKGFTVIQAVALAELDGLDAPNPYGHLPLTDNDPTKPNEDYWKHVDFIVNEAARRGLVMGFLPTWGDKWNGKGLDPQIFNPKNAEAYGEWLGKRYQEQPLIWILGGDRLVENDTHREIIRAMARGLRKGDAGRHLITFHPRGGSGSAEVFHAEEWLDFNMRQNGHGAEFDGHYDKTRFDYDRTPIKPVIDAEPIYEDHPVNFNAKNFGHSIAADVRRPLYWNLFVGACGHTYGNHCVWQMWDPKKNRQPINAPLLPWQEALDQPGALQMQHARRLLESRPYLTRIPDDSLMVESSIKTAMPGAGIRRFVATRDTEGTYALVYAPVGRPFKVRMEVITGPKVKAWWFNPRTGTSTPIGEFPNTGLQTFTSPNPGEFIDWVLVLDDSAKAYFIPPQH